MATGEGLRKSLYSMLTQAEIDLIMWKAMRKERSNPEVLVMLNRSYGRYYIAAENALFNSLITILYKAFETRRDTVNFWELKRKLPSTMPAAVECEINALFSKIKKVWKRILIVRNKVVGHQASEGSIEDFHREAGITITELEDVVFDMQNLLYLIAHHFYDTHVIFNLKGSQSFENLINDLLIHNSFKPKPL